MNEDRERGPRTEAKSITTIRSLEVREKLAKQTGDFSELDALKGFK